MFQQAVQLKKQKLKQTPEVEAFYFAMVWIYFAIICLEMFQKLNLPKTNIYILVFLVWNSKNFHICQMYKYFNSPSFNLVSLFLKNDNAFSDTPHAQLQKAFKVWVEAGMVSWKWETLWRLRRKWLSGAWAAVSLPPFSFLSYCPEEEAGKQQKQWTTANG